MCDNFSNLLKRILNFNFLASNTENNNPKYLKHLANQASDGVKGERAVVIPSSGSNNYGL